MSCRQSQQHNQQTNDDDGGDSTGGIPPSAERNLEGSSEEEGLSETTKLTVPQSAANVPFGVVQRRVFEVSGSVNRAVCPIRPKLDVCMLVRSSLIHSQNFFELLFALKPGSHGDKAFIHVSHTSDQTTDYLNYPLRFHSLQGPPEFEPLGCYESDGERDTSLSTTCESILWSKIKGFIIYQVQCCSLL